MYTRYIRSRCGWGNGLVNSNNFTTCMLQEVPNFKASRLGPADQWGKEDHRRSIFSSPGPAMYIYEGASNRYVGPFAANVKEDTLEKC